MQIGIDLSAVDKRKPIDWKTVRSTGCQFVIFRGTYNTWIDSSWQNEALRAKQEGLIVGAYLFPVMTISAPSPKKQVQAFVKAIGSLSNVDFPPVLDVEYSTPIANTGRSRKELLAWIRLAVAELKAAFGVAPIIYTSARVWDGSDVDALDVDGLGVPAPELIECPLWLARYPYKTRIDAVGDQKAELDRVEKLPFPPVPKSWGAGNCWIHQYQGDALNFPGTTRSVDMNRFFDLRLGAKDERVKWVQRKLGVKVDGDFGQQTRYAVKQFQAENNLTQDGIVGPKTFVRLCWVRNVE